MQILTHPFSFCYLRRKPKLNKERKRIQEKKKDERNNRGREKEKEMKEETNRENGRERRKKVHGDQNQFRILFKNLTNKTNRKRKRKNYNAKITITNYTND